MAAFLFINGLGFAQKKFETGKIEFEFRNTESFSEAALLDILLLPREKYFNAVNLDEDLQRIEKFYFDNGFFDALVDTITTVAESDNEVNVKFIIIENPRYSIREIQYSGLEKVSDQVLNKIKSDRLIEAGSPYVKTQVNLEKDRIISILQNNGYFYSQIDTGRSRIDSSSSGILIGKYSDELQKNPEFDNKVLIKFHFIGTDNQYRFGKININIEKNIYQIDRRIVEREITFKEGDIFNRGKMLESERNFTKLSIIQLGRILPDTVDESGKTITIEALITLNKKYEMTPSISAVYLSNRLYMGAGIEYKDKDFFGGGRVFSVGLEGLFNSVDNNKAELSLSVFQPFLFRSNITSTLTNNIGIWNYNESTEYLYSETLLRTTYFIADYTFYNNAYLDLKFDNFRLRAKKDIRNFDEDGNLLSVTPQGTRLYIQNSILGLTLLHNNTNSIFNPSDGFYHSITAESAGLIPRLFALFNKDILFSQYVKLYTNNSFYIDISGGRATTITAANFKIGDIIEYGKGENIYPLDPIYKFFSGGGNSLRGWRAQKNGILTNTENGGKFLLEGSIELRRKPFPERSILNPVWIVLFLDYGNVWETESKFRLDQIALATGFGIRYDTFVGPVRIDLGFKLFNPSEKEGNKWLWNNPKEIFKSKYAIQFGLGNAF